MADKKISALTAATTPLAGSEVLPIVQGGVTVKVSVDDLTAGKLVTTGPIVSVGTGKDRLVIEPQNAGSGALVLGTNAAGNAYTPVLIDGSLTKLSVGGVEVARTNSNGIAPVAGKGIDFSANANAPGMTSEVLTWYEEGTWTPNQGAGLVVTGSFSSTGTYTRIGRQVTVRGTLSGSTNIAANAVGVMCSNLPFASAADTPGNYFNGSVTSGGQIDAAASSIYAVGAIAATNTIYFSVTYFV